MDLTLSQVPYRGAVLVTPEVSRPAGPSVSRREPGVLQAVRGVVARVAPPG